MNIEYKKIFNKNYAIINNYNIENYKECYRSKMLKSNKLEHFLPYDTQNLNGSIQFTYDISSKQSIESFYENSTIDYETIRHFIMSLKAAFDTLNNFLLEPDYIILQPNLIYMNITTKTLYFCYCPGEKNNFYESLNNFLCYILSKINHDDNNSIILAYSLQQQSMTTNYTFDDLLEILNKPVFQHTKEPEPQHEMSPNKNISSPEFYHTSDTIDYDSYENTTNSISSPEPFDSIPSMITKKSNFHISTLLLGGIFLLICAIAFYYGYYIKNFSIESTLIICAIAGFVCFNLGFTFTKEKIAGNTISKNKDFNHIIMKKDNQNNIIFSDDNFSDNNFSDDINYNEPYNNFENNISTEARYSEDTVILGYRTTENTPKLIYTGTDFESVNELTSFPYIIGKMKDNVNMVISHPMISRIHAKIYFKENHYYIEDMNSSNGTYINDCLILPHTLTELSPGDYITFAHLTYIFQ